MRHTQPKNKGCHGQKLIYTENAISKFNPICMWNGLNADTE